MSLKLAIPSKGRLHDGVVRWFGERGITLERGRHREYSGRVAGLKGLSIVLIPASEIPRDLLNGNVQLGVTGMDVLEDAIPDWKSRTRILARMGFGYADLVIAVPKAWIDVDSLDDLDAVAAQFRRRHGRRLRIATKYHFLTREFLRDFGVADYQLVDSQGATEGTVANETAEAIADITTTGSTLRANHLKTLVDGTILRSQAALYLSLNGDFGQEDRECLRSLTVKCGLNTSLQNSALSRRKR